MRTIIPRKYGSPKPQATASRSCFTTYVLPARAYLEMTKECLEPMNAKHGLGRGLAPSCLHRPPLTCTESPASNVQELPIDSIVANP